MQGDLEQALTTVLRTPVELTVAGRTDAGVHALGQVVSLTTEGALTPTAVRAALNALLPADVRVLDAVETAEVDETPAAGDVTAEPVAEHGVVVEGDNVSPELAEAAAAEINAAETGDAATESLSAPGGESAPDPK